MDREIKYALVKNRYSDITENHLETWDEFINRFKSPEIGDKDGKGFLPADIDVGPRNASRVLSLDLLVLDVEAKTRRINGKKEVSDPSPPPFNKLMENIEGLGLLCLGHTSYSHKSDKIIPKGKVERYRLIFLLSRAIQPCELKPLGQSIAEKLNITECYDKGAL